MSKIIWTKTAHDSLDEILQYLTEKFGEKIALIFFNECMEVVESINRFNDIGIRLIDNPVYRKFIIAKKTTLFYSIREDDVYIHYFFNNRMDPKLLRKILGV